MNSSNLKYYNTLILIEIIEMVEIMVKIISETIIKMVEMVTIIIITTMAETDLETIIDVHQMKKELRKTSKTLLLLKQISKRSQLVNIAEILINKKIIANMMKIEVLRKNQEEIKRIIL